MVRTGVATVARAAGGAVLAGAVALGLAAAMAVGPGMDTAHATPDSPNPPNGTGTLYGDPEAAAPFWRDQQYDDDCVPMAIADVVGELTGSQPSEHAIVEVAHSTPSITHSGPVYTIPEKQKHGEGTSFNDEPMLLGALRHPGGEHHQGQGRKDRCAHRIGVTPTGSGQGPQSDCRGQRRSHLGRARQEHEQGR